MGTDGALTHWRGFQLSRFQLRAVRAVRSGHNVLVSAPTGAGKTLVAEFAMEDAVRRGRRCIYTAPIKALSNQKYRDFRDDPEVDVGIMTGDVTINAHAQVLIMTTEILRNAIFENAALLADVEFVIFDEIHYMDDRERGTVWEESLIFLPEQVRIISLSATISNLEQVGAWIREIRPHEVEVIRSSRRPVPLSHWLYFDKVGSFDPSKLDRVRKKLGADRRPPRDPGKDGRRGSQRRQRDPGPDPRGLFDELQRGRLLPCLVFSFSRRDCERLARQNERRDLLSPEEHARMDEFQAQLIELFQLGQDELDGELFTMARHGVAYHHAGLLPVHKEVVERMFTAGLLKLLFTTETFALGINMPARTVVFHSLRKFDGISFDWLRTRDYMQMAGRAGRQGIDETGYVYSLVGPREIREAPLKRYFGGQPEPVVSRFRLAYSTLLHLVSRLGRGRVHEAWEKSFHQFQGRAKNRHAREKQRLVQRRFVEAHLSLLEELGYLRGDEVTARGRIAQNLAGYELQVTEMLFEGVLENLTARSLAVIFVGMIFEERRRHERTYVPQKILGDLRHRVGMLVSSLCSREARHGIEPGMKRPDWGLAVATLAWFDGCTFEELEQRTEANPGDTCRVFRMAIQLMRSVRRTIDADWDLFDRLQEAIDALNRDEVDARRQLELG